MKLQAIKQQNTNSTIRTKESNMSAPSFKGGDEFLRFLATNQAWGANGTDLAFMVFPRSVTDTVNRGLNAGLETTRREIMGTVNDTMIGAYGLAAGALLSAGLKKKCPVSWNQIFSGRETVDYVAEKWNDKAAGKINRKDFFSRILTDLEAFEPDNPRASADGYIKLTNTDEIAKKLDDAVDTVDIKKWRKSQEKALVKAKIVENTGVDKKFRIKSGNKVISTSLDTVLDDYFKLTKTFDDKKVEQYITQDSSKIKGEASKLFSESRFIKDLKKLGRNKTIGGIALAAAVGMSVQPINMYLSKKKTGVDGFVGVDGREKDKSFGFKLVKLGAMTAFGALMLKTIGCGPKGFLDHMAYKDMLVPTLDQFKGVYGLTIMSRIAVARDKDECREVCVKDTLGFLNWLVLGNFVNKLVAKTINPELIKFNEAESGKGFWNRLTKTTLKTHDEIMYKAMKESGLSPIVKQTVNEAGNIIEKETVMKYGQMKKLIGKTSPAAVKALKQIKALNIAQLVGYAYTGIILGWGVPKINIAMTNNRDSRRKNEIKKMMYSQENQGFVKQRMADLSKNANSQAQKVS